MQIFRLTAAVLLCFGLACSNPPSLSDCTQTSNELKTYSDNFEAAMTKLMESPTRNQAYVLSQAAIDSGKKFLEKYPQRSLSCRDHNKVIARIDITDYETIYRVAQSTPLTHVKRLEDRYPELRKRWGPPPPNPPTPPLPPLVKGHGGVRGKILMPNGIDPVDTALVYIPKAGNETLDFTGIKIPTTPFWCGEPPEAYHVKVCTGPTGEFLIPELPTGEMNLTFKKGFFMKTVPITIVDKLIVEMNQEFAQLPTTPAPNVKIPKIAVITGSYDHLDVVLDKLGLAGIYKVFANINALYPTDIKNYDLILINCGTSEILNATNVGILRAYIENGGRLYATDQAYDFVEQVWPGAVDYVGDKNPNSSGPANAAQKGNQTNTIYGHVKSANLAAWLGAVKCAGGPCITGADEIQLHDFSSSWAVMKSVGANTSTWVDGDYDGNPTRPMSVSFEAGKGKVFYSSYHTAHGNSGADLYPQERVLQFFILDILQ